jgi:septum formation protein
MKIILGSESKDRREILEKAGFVFEVMPAYIDEKLIRNSNPSALTLQLALAKRDALLPRIHEQALLVTSDQVIVYAGSVREKPTNEQEAFIFLSTLHLYPSESVSSVVVTRTVPRKSMSATDTARIYFRKIPEVVISEYIRTGDPYHMAGGFNESHPLISPYVTRFEGEKECMLGLPLVLTVQMIHTLSDSA